MDDTEIKTYIILKYGGLSRAFHYMANLKTNKQSEDYDMLNLYFGRRSLLDRLADETQRRT